MKLCVNMSDLQKKSLCANWGWCHSNCDCMQHWDCQEHGLQHKEVVPGDRRLRPAHNRVQPASYHSYQGHGGFCQGQDWRKPQEQCSQDYQGVGGGQECCVTCCKSQPGPQISCSGQSAASDSSATKKEASQVQINLEPAEDRKGQGADLSSEKKFTVDCVGNSRSTRYITRKPEDVPPPSNTWEIACIHSQPWCWGSLGVTGRPFPPSG